MASSARTIGPDAVRYADTNGIHFDNYREIWPYRDWVIAAFNRNQPYKQFAMEQIAGDLLPNATLDQRIATGFQRSNVTTNEAGIIEDEYTEIYAKDRADTFGSVFLGLTVGCATCHDHKFDPISQKDYYSLGAFFRNTPQKVMDGNTSDQPPFVMVPRQQDRARWDQIATRQAAIVQEMSHARAAAATPFETWLRNREPAAPATLFDEKETLYAANLGQLAAPGGDLKLGIGGRPALYFASTGGASVAAPPKLDAEKPFSIAVSFLSPKGDTPKGDAFNLAAQQNPKDKNRGWVLDVSGRLASFRLIGDSGENIEIRAAMDRIEPSTWNSIVVAYDGSRAQSGLDLYLNGHAILTQGRNNPNTKLIRRNQRRRSAGAGKIFSGWRHRRFPHHSSRSHRIRSRRTLGKWGGPPGPRATPWSRSCWRCRRPRSQSQRRPIPLLSPP